MMSELEKQIVEQIKRIVPAFDELDVRANIGDNNYSVEFFVAINGKKMQCFDMVDDGLIQEKDMDAVADSIAEYVRKTSFYESGKINKILVKIVNE